MQNFFERANKFFVLYDFIRITTRVIRISLIVSEITLIVIGMRKRQCPCISVSFARSLLGKFTQIHLCKKTIPPQHKSCRGTE